MSETSNKTTNEGRDSGGRFAQGNKGGPGNPFARQAAAFRKTIQEAVTPVMMATIAGVVAQKALGGDLAAARLLFSYGIGKPGPSPDPDTLDAHELAVRRQNTATAEDMKALFEGCPAELLCAIAATVAPLVQAHMEKQFADGVRRQTDLEQQGRQSVPDAPGPYAGWKADWAPDWLKRGIPDSVAELFENCPVWAPDHLGTDKLPHAYGDMLRNLRSDLFDALTGPAVSQRRSASEADRKRGKRQAAAAREGESPAEPTSPESSAWSSPADRLGLDGSAGASPSRGAPDGADGNKCPSAPIPDTKREKPTGLKLSDLLGPDALF